VIVGDYGYYYKKNEVFAIVLFDMVHVLFVKICSFDCDITSPLKWHFVLSHHYCTGPWYSSTNTNKR